MAEKNQNVEGDSGDLHERIRSIVEDLGRDERQVLLEVAKRLYAGQSAYGRLVLSTDRRDWRTEASEEAIDLAVYLAMRLLTKKVQRDA